MTPETNDNRSGLSNIKHSQIVYKESIAPPLVYYNITALNVELLRRLLDIQLAKLHSAEAQRSKGNERRTPPNGSFVSQGVEATWQKDARVLGKSNKRDKTRT